jgi:type IV secretory pathway TraG/TraD family ATPase VirD4
LVALKLVITQRLLSRYNAQWNDNPISRRGVVILQDEAQLLLSDSEAKALSVIREFGVIWILATQSVSLIGSVLQSHMDTAAFVAASRVRIWGNTGDAYTAEMASRFCGTSRGHPQRLACLWHPTPVLEAAVTGATSDEKPLVEPQRFYELKTGQFYLRTADNESYFLDLRLSLTKPTSRNLRHLTPAAAGSRLSH